MWGETCPILTEVRTWFKDKSLEDMGRKYWKKRSYLFQGFVVDSPMKEENTPENPIRRFIMGPQIYNIIKMALMDPEMEELPTDEKRGIDFRVTKTSKGGYADYGTSSWGRRERPLSEAELAAIEQYGLSDLNSFMPKKPTADELVLMKEMFEASVNGDAYDLDKFGSIYKPYSGKQSDDEAADGEVTPISKPAPRAVESKPAPAAMAAPAPTADAEPKAASSKRAEDVLKMIRDRQAK
jgi:hypothetical protein